MTTAVMEVTEAQAPEQPVEDTGVNTDVTRRNIRMKDILPQERLNKIHAVVVGVGAIGRQLAVQLAAMGVGKLTLFDFDKVSSENLGVQGFPEYHIGLPKVESVAGTCRALNSSLNVETHNSKFKASYIDALPPDDNLVVFSCTDKMPARKFLWEKLAEKRGLFVDGRMSAEVIRILTCDLTLESFGSKGNFYTLTLFTEEEAFAGSCTAKSTLYSAGIAANLMIAQMSLWTRGLLDAKDFLFDVKSMSMIYNKTDPPAPEDIEPVPRVQAVDGNLAGM